MSSINQVYAPRVPEAPLPVSRPQPVKGIANETESLLRSPDGDTIEISSEARRLYEAEQPPDAHHETAEEYAAADHGARQRGAPAEAEEEVESHLAPERLRPSQPPEETPVETAARRVLRLLNEDD